MESKLSLADYVDVCPECESWELRFTDEKLNEQGTELHFTAICRECGLEWEDYIDAK